MSKVITPETELLVIAIRLALDKHDGIRAWDNCFEMGDADEVSALMIDYAKQDACFKEALSSLWPQAALRDGFPERMLDSWEKLRGLSLFAHAGLDA